MFFRNSDALIFVKFLWAGLIFGLIAQKKFCIDESIGQNDKGGGSFKFGFVGEFEITAGRGRRPRRPAKIYIRQRAFWAANGASRAPPPTKACINPPGNCNFLFFITIYFPTLYLCFRNLSTG